jgi:hypothetical protein
MDCGSASSGRGIRSRPRARPRAAPAGHQRARRRSAVRAGPCRARWQQQLGLRALLLQPPVALPKLDLRALSPLGPPRLAWPAPAIPSSTRASSSLLKEIVRHALRQREHACGIAGRAAGWFRWMLVGCCRQQALVQTNSARFSPFGSCGPAAVSPAQRTFWKTTASQSQTARLWRYFRLKMQLASTRRARLSISRATASCRA